MWIVKLPDDWHGDDVKHTLPAMPTKCCQSPLSVFIENSPQMQLGQRMLREEVTAADIAEVTAKWTGIPV